MNESTARAERRALRRAMGPHVQAFTTDMTQAIRLLQQSLASQQEDLNRAWTAVHALECHTVRHHDRITAIERQRMLRERLRWLLTGR